ncbi:hypothetical protein AVEN_183466-1 [Araneus ventricosus]|uniref:Uncharacterized protein n=1 Tax=Araneus ventricosus TaxID=182803 RepID=A0A4Y2TQE9_ARAVE|nr:hypothetical protein AVEN_183466-1 [Araneus ventricosus]
MRGLKILCTGRQAFTANKATDDEGAGRKSHYDTAPLTRYATGNANPKNALYCTGIIAKAKVRWAMASREEPRPKDALLIYINTLGSGQPLTRSSTFGSHAPCAPDCTLRSATPFAEHPARHFARTLDRASSLEAPASTFRSHQKSSRAQAHGSTLATPLARAMQAGSLAPYPLAHTLAQPLQAHPGSDSDLLSSP